MPLPNTCDSLSGYIQERQNYIDISVNYINDIRREYFPWRNTTETEVKTTEADVKEMKTNIEGMKTKLAARKKEFIKLQTQHQCMIRKWVKQKQRTQKKMKCMIKGDSLEERAWMIYLKNFERYFSVVLIAVLVAWYFVYEFGTWYYWNQFLDYLEERYNLG